MCGYLERTYGEYSFAEALKPSGLGNIYAELDGRPPGKSSFQPAVANLMHRTIPDVVIENDEGERKLINPVWWYDTVIKNGELRSAGKQSFNARNLQLPTWQEPIRYRRGIAMMTGLGESIFTKPENKGKQQFLMRAEKPILLGILYQRLDDDIYSAAVITRQPQNKFKVYHDKATPFFINPDKYFVDKWLSKKVTEEDPDIADLLLRPTWFQRMEVQRVKTFTGAQLFKNSVTEILEPLANRL